MNDIRSWVYGTFDEVLPYGNTDLRVTCPFCDDSSHHLHISLIKSVCHCFRCNYSGSWNKLIRDVDGVDYREAKQTLQQHSRLAMVPLYMILKQREKNIESQNVDSMPDTFMTINTALATPSVYIQKAAAVVKKYIDIRMKHVLYNGWYDRWGIWTEAKGYGQLVLPVERGWWVYRSVFLRHDGAKYIACSSPKEDRLYNSAALSGPTVYIAEGIFSAEHLGRNAIALCGMKATPQQVDRLVSASAKQYIVCLDANTTKESLELANTLHRHNKHVIVRNYESGDPANHGVFTDSEYNYRVEVMARLAV